MLLRSPFPRAALPRAPLRHTFFWALSLSLFAAGCAREAAQETTPEEAPPRVSVAFRLTEIPTGDDDIPRSEAALILVEDAQMQRRELPLGRLEGACLQVQATDALAGVDCWWAGFGERLRLWRHGDELVVERLTLAEDGTEESEELLRAPLPSGADLQVIGAHTSTRED